VRPSSVRPTRRHASFPHNDRLLPGYLPPKGCRAASHPSPLPCTLQSSPSRDLLRGTPKNYGLEVASLPQLMALLNRIPLASRRRSNSRQKNRFAKRLLPTRLFARFKDKGQPRGRAVDPDTVRPYDACPVLPCDTNHLQLQCFSFFSRLSETDVVMTISFYSFRSALFDACRAEPVGVRTKAMSTG